MIGVVETLSLVIGDGWVSRKSVVIISAFMYQVFTNTTIVVFRP